MNSRTHPGLLWLLAACLMTQPLATDLYLPSLPHIAHHFHTTPSGAQQTLSLFVLGFAALQLVSGPLSDHLGRRPVLMLGLAIYSLSSIACIFASSLDMLIIGRCLQAIGCGTVVVVTRAIVHDVYPGAEGAHAMARISSLYALAPLLGPLLGGYLQIVFGWRAAFVAYALFGAWLMGIVFIRLRETRADHPGDEPGLGRFARDYLRIVSHPAFWAYTVPGALSFGTIFIFLSGSAFLLINVFSVPTQYTGLFFACGAACYMAGTLACRRLLRQHGAGRTLRLGCHLAFCACLVYPASVMAGLAHWSTLLLGCGCVMFAHGINFPCAQSGAVAPFPKSAGAAAALMGSCAMALAFGLGSLVGMTYDGTPFPLAVILAGTGTALLASGHFLARNRPARSEPA